MILNKITQDTNVDVGDSTFNDLGMNKELPDTSKAYLDAMPFTLKKWQTDHILSDEEDQEIYQNPLKPILTEASQIVDGIITLSSATYPELFNSASLASAEIKLFMDHTDRLSGVANQDTLPKDDKEITKKPTLHTALSVGQNLLTLSYNTSAFPALMYGDKLYIGHAGQSYDNIIAEYDLDRYTEKSSPFGGREFVDNFQEGGLIKTGYADKEGNFLSKKDADNTAMLGSFTSLYTEKPITEMVDKLKADVGVLETGSLTETGTLNFHQTAVDLDELTAFMKKRRISDETFFQNGVQVLKKLHNVQRVNNMGHTHQMLMDKIGTPAGKKMLSG